VRVEQTKKRKKNVIIPLIYSHTIGRPPEKEKITNNSFYNVGFSLVEYQVIIKLNQLLANVEEN
jgi:hypothetical protein